MECLGALTVNKADRTPALIEFIVQVGECSVGKNTRDEVIPARDKPWEQKKQSAMRESARARPFRCGGQKHQL